MPRNPGPRGRMRSRHCSPRPLHTLKEVPVQGVPLKREDLTGHRQGFELRTRGLRAWSWRPQAER